MDDFSLEPLPFEEAIRALKARGVNLAPSFDYRDLWQKAHATAFTVAKSTGFDILNDIYTALDDALVKGTSFEDFKAVLTPKLQAKGWWGTQVMRDPKTGVEKIVQLGSDRRMAVIFNTNVRTASAAGDWARFQETKSTRPYLWYVSVLDERTRPEHAAWHDTVLPIDDPWWETHFPPNDWGCRCIAQSVSDTDLERYGLKISDKPPPTKAKPYVNPRTGESSEVPEGIAPPFAYNPGKASIEGNAARIFLEKAIPLPAEVTAEITRVSADVAIDALAPDFEKWSQDILDRAGRKDMKGKGELRPVGILGTKTIEHLHGKGLKPASAVIAVQDHEIVHMVRDNKTETLSADDITQLPSLLRKPKAVIFEETSGSLFYLWDVPGRAGWVGAIIAKPIFIETGWVPGKDKRIKAPVVSIRSGRYQRLKGFFNPKAMTVIEGEL